ncbi:MAG: hypothetical protein GWN41_06815 [Phycisphaerae bacterium]|nr:hypothetical protein [Phycisphaerae bacterium]
MFKTLAILPEDGFLAGEKWLLLVIYSPKCSANLLMVIVNWLLSIYLAPFTKEYNCFGLPA